MRLLIFDISNGKLLKKPKWEEDVFDVIFTNYFKAECQYKGGVSFTICLITKGKNSQFGKKLIILYFAFSFD